MILSFVIALPLVSLIELHLVQLERKAVFGAAAAIALLFQLLKNALNAVIAQTERKYLNGSFTMIKNKAKRFDEKIERKRRDKKMISAEISMNDEIEYNLPKGRYCATCGEFLLPNEPIECDACVLKGLTDIKNAPRWLRRQKKDRRGVPTKGHALSDIFKSGCSL